MQTRLADDARKRVVWGIALVLIAVTALLGAAPGPRGPPPLRPPRPYPY